MITIDLQSSLTLENVLAVANGGKVMLSERTRKTLQVRRRQIEQYIKQFAQPAYGFNRGFGHNVDQPVSPRHLKELQRNLIRSHSCGMGEHSPISIIRATMLLRANSLARGFSAVRPVLIDQILSYLNHQIVPAVPMFGSVGASGDLAPLSHIALTLIGEGQVYYGAKHTLMSTQEALKKARLKPLQLEMKEGLALSNGVQFSTALGILTYSEVSKLLKTATVATAMTAQVMLASDNPFGEELHKLRNHQGAQIVAKWIRDLMKNSPIREVHRHYNVDGEIQDPYNLRCAGQVLGTCYDLLEEARRTFEIEINSATDNPLILQDHRVKDKFTEITSGGHFHGMPVAVKIYNLLQAMAIMARLSNMRCVRFVDQARNKGLGTDLIWPKLRAEIKATSSGMMIPEYASAALTNWIWGSCMPSHLFSMSTDAGQEDHVSMSAGLGIRAWETVPRLAEVLAIELAYVSQAAYIRAMSSSFPSKLPITKQHSKNFSKEYQLLSKKLAKQFGKSWKVQIDLRLNFNWNKRDRKLSPVCEKILAEIRKVFKPVKNDRELSSQLRLLAKKIQEHRFVALSGL